MVLVTATTHLFRGVTTAQTISSSSRILPNPILTLLFPQVHTKCRQEPHFRKSRDDPAVFTFAEDEAAPCAAGLLSGSGILSTSSRTLRSLSSDIRRDSRGSSPDILYLEHICKHGFIQIKTEKY